MSVETDVAEIKRDIKNMYNRFQQWIDTQKEFCKIKHEPIDKHMKDGETFRDKVNRHGATIVILTTFIGIIITGITTALILALKSKMGF